MKRKAGEGGTSYFYSTTSWCVSYTPHAQTFGKAAVCISTFFTYMCVVFFMKDWCRSKYLPSCIRRSTRWAGERRERTEAGGGERVEEGADATDRDAINNATPSELTIGGGQEQMRQRAGPLMKKQGVVLDTSTRWCRPWKRLKLCNCGKSRESKARMKSEWMVRLGIIITERKYKDS